MKNKKESFGQYMTPKFITDFMVSLISCSIEGEILEPSAGDGEFIKSLQKNNFNNITAYEIDESIITYDFVQPQSFIGAEINKKFDVVIGNPPYVRWKNLNKELKNELSNNILWNRYLNSLNDYSSIFIIKAVEKLKENGELIFITPEYWMHTTHSSKLREYLTSNGYFSQLYIFKETPIFHGVNVSLIIFKYIKSSNVDTKLKFDVYEYNSRQRLDTIKLNSIMDKSIEENFKHYKIPQFNDSETWILAPEYVQKRHSKYLNKCIKENSKAYVFEEFCEVSNGMVSGLDKAFQLTDYAGLTEEEINKTIKVLKAKSLEQYTHTNTTPYIFIDDDIDEGLLLNRYPNFHCQLSKYRERLDKRYNYNRDIKYWEWVFLRNYEKFKSDTRKIFIPCKERISNKDYFRFAIVEPDVYPTQDVTAIIPKEGTKESIEYIAALLNSRYVFEWLSHRGIVKGNIVEFSRKPLATLPYRKIDFQDEREIMIHNNITHLVRAYLRSKDDQLLQKIENNLNKLFD